jgi:hypothetical protein
VETRCTQKSRRHQILAPHGATGERPLERREPRVQPMPFRRVGGDLLRTQPVRGEHGHVAPGTEQQERGATGQTFGQIGQATANDPEPACLEFTNRRVRRGPRHCRRLI